MIDVIYFCRHRKGIIKSSCPFYDTTVIKGLLDTRLLWTVHSLCLLIFAKCFQLWDAAIPNYFMEATNCSYSELFYGEDDSKDKARYLKNLKVIQDRLG